MSKMIPAGIVTAYGAAVRGGYPGTYEEFCTALGDLARVLEDFEGFRVEVTTLEPGESATADYSDGVLSLGIPAGETGNGIASAELNQNYTLTLTWTNGESTTVGPIRGATGQTPDFAIGTVQTLQPDQPATATITGTPENPVLNLGIPKGDPGQDGASDAGDVTYDPEEDYPDGSIGAEVSQQKNAISQKAPLIINTASGTIASFSDGADGLPVKQVVAEIEPIQDLHGYDHPWPAGGGVNLLNPNATTDNMGLNVNGALISANGWCVSDWIPATANTDYFANNVIPSANGYSMCFYDANKSFLRYKSTDGGGNTVQNSGDDAAYLRVTVNLSKKAESIVAQSSSYLPFSPYENICPISGWTGANVEQRGKNLVVPDNPENPMQNYTHTSTGTVLYSSEYDAFYCSGNGIAEDKRGGAYNTLFVAPNDMTVTFSVDTYNIETIFGLRFYVKGVRVADIHGATNTWEHYAYTVTLAKGQKLQIAYYSSIYWKNLQVVAGTSADQYYPYVANTLPINWQTEAGTVYGGTVDVISGKMVVDRAYHKFTESDNIVANTSDPSTYRWYSSTIKIGNFVNDNGVGFNLFEKTNGVVADKVTASISGGAYGSHNIFFYNFGLFGITNAAEAKQYVVDNGAEVCYYLDTPVEYQLAPQEVTTLLGNNVVYTDVGPVSVEYPADTKLYIEQLTKPTEDDMTADHAISAGTFFMIGNNLYLATSQIAAGGTITPGTNATKLSLADALNQLNT